MRSSNYSIEKYKNKIIAVIGGGISSERNISLLSADNVYKTLKQMGLNAIQLNPMNPEFFSTSFDIAFNCLHGQWGEDGGIQGYCEIKQIPYTGPGIKATSIGLNKPLFKSILKDIEIPVPEQVKGPNRFPFIVKPASEGSSIGISIVKNKNEYDQLVNQNPDILTKKYFFEEFITGQEITSGVIEIDNKPTILPLLEIETDNEFLDYEAKYTPGKTRFICPANVSSNLNKEIHIISKKIFEFFECKGCIRIDFMIDNGKPKVLEMNTSPGLTNLSDIPAQAKAMDIQFDELMIHYLNSAK
tara:strand:- start:1629 stop:2531 length:903 start_codon:yes stop_codon:yes gene_type:complete